MTAEALAPMPTRSVAGKDRWLPAVLVVWAVIYAILIAMNLGGLARGEFHDPDDQLRLQQVRDLLAGQSWFDIHQYRIDAAGGGVAMHWSRLVDVPIAAVMLVARPLLGAASAELAAFLIVPALTLLAILALVGWMAVRVLPRPALPFALLAVAFAAPVIVQVLPARIDHHGWQIALALAAMAAFLDGNERRGGWITGAALAAWMAISFEGLPLSAWIVAVMGLTALADTNARVRLVAAMQALAVVSAGLFLATRGLADLAQHCDAIAPVHLAVFGWGAIAITAAHRFGAHSRAALAAGLGVAALGALAIVGTLAPQCTTGSFDMLDPVVRGFWYDNVHEGKPIFGSEWHLIAQYALPPSIGLWAAIRLALRSTGERRRWWVLYAFVLAGALVIGLAVARAASISGALAALPLGWQVSRWLSDLKRPANPLLRVGELLRSAGLIFLTLLPVVPVMAIETLTGVAPAAKDEQPVIIACNAAHARAAIAALPPGGILAPLDMGPDLLIATDRDVLATGHHRGAAAMRQTIDAFSGSPEQARAVMRAKRLRYLAICPRVQELDLYRERAPDGFAAQLKNGRVPQWLKPVPMPAAAGLKMWQRLD